MWRTLALRLGPSVGALFGPLARGTDESSLSLRGGKAEPALAPAPREEDPADVLWISSRLTGTPIVMR